jgi:hypothetical protein
MVFSGCGESLNFTSLDGSTSVEEPTVTTVETQVASEVTSPTEAEQTYFDTPSTIISLAEETSAESIANTIVFEETTVPPVTTTVEVTTTTTNILSAYGGEEELLALASSLYGVACDMYWNYYVGSPYPLDYDDSIETDFGTLFAVDDDDIKTLDDVKQHWYEVFTSTIDPEDFDGSFAEKNGKLYSSDSDRGSNIYYESTDITEIVSIVDDEITFNAVSHYADPEDGSEAYDETNEFSIILEDGAFHVGKFTLPY